MAGAICQQLQGELQRLEAEEQRLLADGQRLRSELRRARASARVASTLHQDIFSTEPQEPAAGSQAASTLREHLRNAEDLAAKSCTEVEDLKRRLAEQEELHRQAAQLVATLEQGCSHRVGGYSTGDPAPMTSRSVKLVRETAELRLSIAHVEGRIQQLQAAPGTGDNSLILPSGRETPRSQRGEIRQLQQLDSVALRLHEELRRRRSLGSAASATSSPLQRISATQASSHAPSYCGTSFSRISTKSEMLENQLEGFYKRFMVRRSGLVMQRAR